jgi:hypothetical protein
LLPAQIDRRAVAAEGCVAPRCAAVGCMDNGIGDTLRRSVTVMLGREVIALCWCLPVGVRER